METRDKTASPLVQAAAKAIVQADEQNGGPPWDYLMLQGKHVIGPIYDGAEEAIAAVRKHD